MDTVFLLETQINVRIEFDFPSFAKKMGCGSLFKRLKKNSRLPKKFSAKLSVRSRDVVEVLHLKKKRRVQEPEVAPVESQEPERLLERLPSPDKSPTDESEYSVIRLSNGVTATIISEAKEPVEAGKKNINKKSMSQSPDPKYVEPETSVASRIARASSRGSLGGIRSHREFDVTDSDWLAAGLNLAVDQTFAACAVTIQVGSFNDPEHIPGLCHLLEHVVSMGSDNFPGEDEFEAFLGQTGGSYGAETETEHVSFYFECQEKVLYHAMEVFSRFFIAPLINWDSVRRERLAVASEFAEQTHSDNARRMRIICNSAKPNNPAKKFSWGNLETLKDNISPQELQDALGEFRKYHFTADRVKVAVQAKISAETLEGWVDTFFSELPAKEVVGPTINMPLETLFDKSKFCKFYKVQSVGEICEINLNWVIPPIQTKYKYRPTEYISYVIGAEGEGSLISFLRTRRLALYLTSEVEEGGLVSNSLYTIFTVCISLTEEGRNNIKDIIKSVFGYLKMLRLEGPSKSIWMELQTISDIAYKYNRNNRAKENVKEISHNMTIFPPDDYLMGPTKFFEYRGEEIQAFLGFMTPAAANILLHAKRHDEQLDLEEQWFKTRYRVDKIPASWLKEWNAVEPEHCFNLPPPNAYIADDFSLIEEQNTSEYPRKLVETKSYEIWHKRDATSNKPYAAINILLSIPQEQQTLQNIVNQILFSKMFVYQMIDELYFAQVAHIEHKMKSTECGLDISIYGVSQKLTHVLKDIAHGLVEFRERAESQKHLLKYLKVAVERKMINTLSNGAKFLEDTRKSINSSLTYMTGEKYPHVRSITEEVINQYWQSMMANVYVVAFVQGNISSNKAKGTIEEFVYVLKAFARSGTIARPATRMLPEGETIVCLAAFHPEEENCYTQFYYQFGPGGAMDSVALQIFVTSMSEPLYDELRTKEQLGHNVSVTVSELLGVLGITISVNSQINRHSPEYVRTRIDTFVKDYLKYFRILSRTEFEELKQVLVTIKQMTRLDLKEESSLNWFAIKNRQTDFDRATKEIRAIVQIDKKSTIKVVDKTMDTSKYGSARKLALQIIGYKSGEELDEEARSKISGDEVFYRIANTETSTPNAQIVKDVLAWKNSLPTFVLQENKMNN